MNYKTSQALRMALEQRLLNRSTDSSRAPGVSLDRLRRRVVFERILARLQAAEPDLWVLKGGMALEVRLGDCARLSKDIDLGLRSEIGGAEEMRERLIEALGADPDGDSFVLTTGPAKRLMEDDGGRLTWRVKVVVELADRPFGGIQIDISPRADELHATDLVQLPNSLRFAGIATPFIEIIDIHRHAAEKLHGMLKDFGDRENTRVRDLFDLILLIEHDLLEPHALAEAVQRVWGERGATGPPASLPSLPASWPGRYERLASEYNLTASSFDEATAIVTAWWAEIAR